MLKSTSFLRNQSNSESEGKTMNLSRDLEELIEKAKKFRNLPIQKRVDEMNKEMMKILRKHGRLN